MRRAIDREVRGNWRFGHSIVTERSDTGTLTVTNGGKPSQSGMGSGVNTRFVEGDRVMTLGSSRGDLPMAIGTDPWISG